MNCNVKVSVIVPVYNVENYLNRCVLSLLTQSLHEIEIILVDDGSPDNCPQMCDTFAEGDNRVKVVHKENGGLGYARNSGLEHATGKYVMFVDSDDYLDTVACEWLYNQAEANCYDAIYYRYEVFTEKALVIGHNSDESIEEFIERDDVRNFMAEMVGSLPSSKKDRNVEMSSCTAFYKRSVIVDNDIKFHSERELISEDLVFNMDILANATRVAKTNCSFYHYFVNTSSLTHKVRLDRIEQNLVFYRFVLKKLQSQPGYTGTDALRAMRMFIGYCRATIIQVLKSDCSNEVKSKWLKSVCGMHVWKEIHDLYPLSKLPFKYALFYEAKYRKQYWLLKLMALL